MITDSKLAQGTKIILRTATTGAVIRYTLDDTCPCEDTALTYSKPITFTGDMVLRAAAYKNGIYSKTIRLELSIDTAGGEVNPAPELYQVIFDSQGGSAVRSIVVSKSGKVTKPVNPTRNGFDFSGWYKKRDCMPRGTLPLTP